jgi:hypothetical protein
MLPTYRRQLGALVDVLAGQRLGLQKIAASFASQAYQLTCLLDSQRGRFEPALYWGKDEYDPSFAYTYFDYFSLYEDIGLMHFCSAPRIVVGNKYRSISLSREIATDLNESKSVGHSFRIIHVKKGDGSATT